MWSPDVNIRSRNRRPWRLQIWALASKPCCVCKWDGFEMTVCLQWAPECNQWGTEFDRNQMLYMLEREIKNSTDLNPNPAAVQFSFCKYIFAVSITVFRVVLQNDYLLFSLSLVFAHWSSLSFWYLSSSVPVKRENLCLYEIGGNLSKSSLIVL